MSSRPVPLPSLAWHWSELQRRPEAWAVIARNLVPVVGIFALHWAASLVVFNIWFDGVTGLMAIVTVLLPRAMRESSAGKPVGPVRTGLGFVVGWVFLVGIVCLPYWVALIPLQRMFAGGTLLQHLRTTPSLWVTFAGIAVGHLYAASRRGYDLLPEREMKQALRTDAYLLVMRAVVLFLLAGNFFLVLLVPALALFSAYVELWPRNALAAVFGDPDKLWQDDGDVRAERRAAQQADHDARSARKAARRAARREAPPSGGGGAATT